MDSNPTTNSHPASGGIFVTTQWTRVLATRGDSPEARQALGDLCAVYYEPVFILMRRAAPNEDAARDLTQEFFAHLLSRQSMDHVNPQRGRFRYFMLGAVKHFLTNARERQNRLKRGGGQTPLSLDAGTDTSPGIEVADASIPSPDLEFDRKWALTLLDRALNRLSAEQGASGKGEQFEALKPWLTGDKQDGSQAHLAAHLSMNESTLKVTIHRLRKRFRDLVKDEIAGTVDDPAQVREELNYLIEALSGR